jgi:hypothetical protein
MRHASLEGGVQGFDMVTTVPGTWPREGEHPLVHIVGGIVGQTKDRFEPLLAPGPAADTGGKEMRLDRYRATCKLSERPRVLLTDDTWTTGDRAQSAAVTLREAGAARIAVVVIGRHFDRAFGPGEVYYNLSRSGAACPCSPACPARCGSN